MERVSDMMFWIALARGKYSDPLSLVPHQAQVYSQNGEDGIVAEIFSRIGPASRYFVEIGAYDGTGSNSRFLLEQGWRGTWIERDAEAVGRARATFDGFVQSGALMVVEGTAQIDNLGQLLDRAGVPRQIDFLSVDVDQNTASLWQAFDRQCRAACIEYNASVPPSAAAQVPYEPDAAYDHTNWFGAGLKVLETIGRAKAMSLVGCELVGVNAFFVASAEAAGKFRAPFTAEEHYEPPRYAASGQWGHAPSSRPRRWVP